MKLICKFFVLVLLAAMGIFGEAIGQSWTPQISGTTNHLWDISFITNTTGWAVGDYGTILKTTNGGTNWVKQVSGFNNNTFNDVQAISESIAMVTGFVNGNLLMRTTNGGTNWTVVNQPFPPSGQYIALYALHFSSVNDIFLVGYQGGKQVVWRTTNGGTNWTSQVFGNGTIRKIFFNGTRGWLVGDNGNNQGVMYRTDNGGATWSQVSLPESVPPINDVSDKGTFICAVTDIGTVIRSVNSGATWAVQSSLGYGHHFKVKAVDSNNAFISTSTGKVLKTTNAGLTWIAETSGTYSIWGLDATTSTTAYAAGNMGQILKYAAASSYTISASTSPTAGGTVTGMGIYQAGQNVTLRAVPNAGYIFINWTINGIQSSTSATYTFPITSNINAVANFQQQRTLPTPTFSLSGGTYPTSQNVSISGTTAGATIRYTTNGSDVTANSSIYSTPIAVSQTMTIKAKAYLTGSNESLQAMATYTINAQPTPVVNLCNDLELILPRNSATAMPLKPYFSWLAYEGTGITYDVEISKFSNFSTIYRTETTSATTLNSDNSISFGFLETGNETYYWRVIAKRNGIAIARSAPRNFRTRTQPPATGHGSVLGTFNNTIAYRNTLDRGASSNLDGKYMGMSWQCVEYCRRYFWINYGLHFSTTGNANTFPTNAPALGFTVFANGGQQMPRIGDILCFDGGSYDTFGHVAIIQNIVFNGNNTYTLCLAHQNVGAGAHINYCEITMTLSNGNYTVNRWCFDNICEDYRDVTHWIRAKAVTPTAPLNRATITNSTPSLEFERLASTVTVNSYTLYMHQKVNGCWATSNAISFNISSTQNFVNLASSTNYRLLNAGDYRFKVVANVPAGQIVSEYSYFTVSPNATPFNQRNEAFKVKDDAILVEDETLSKSMQVYPNPSNGLFSIDIVDNELLGEMSFTITDVTGRTVKSWNQIKEYAKQKVEINLADKAVGVYYLTISHSKGQTVKKLVKN